MSLSLNNPNELWPEVQPARSGNLLPSSVAQPLVSVIVPAYNAETFLASTLNAIGHQSYKNIEILVIDDGSRDRTSQIAETMAQQDSRIRLLKQANAGVAAARNLGIKRAKGEFVAPIDADDWWDAEAIERMVSQLCSAPPQVGVVYTWSLDVDEDNRPLGGFHVGKVTGNVYKTLLCHNFLGNASSTLIRKTCFDKVGGYDVRMREKAAQGCEDWDLYLRLAEHYDFVVVPAFLVAYRKCHDSMSEDFKQMARSQQLMLKTIQTQHPELPNFLYRLSQSSFYLYLAQQCDRLGDARQTRFWLRKMFKVDKITPLGRWGVYRLLIKSVRPKAQASKPVLANNAPKLSAYDSHNIRLKNYTGICPAQIWLKNFIGHVLHQLIQQK